MKTSVEITLKSLSLSSIPEKALLLSRNLLTVEMIWPKVGTPRKSATRQITMKKGKVDFTAEPWAKRVLFREEIDGHMAFTVSIAEPVTMQKLRRLMQLTAKAALKEGADMIDAALVSYGDIAAAPVDALATMVAEKDSPRGIVQGVLDFDDLPKAGETKEVVIPLTRPKFSKQIGTLTLLVHG